MEYRNFVIVDVEDYTDSIHNQMFFRSKSKMLNNVTLDRASSVEVGKIFAKKLGFDYMGIVYVEFVPTEKDMPIV